MTEFRKLSEISIDNGYAYCDHCNEIFVDDNPFYDSFRCPNCKIPGHCLLRGLTLEKAWEMRKQFLKNRRKIIIYICGAYFGNDNGQSINQNIEKAKEVAIQLTNKGFTVICPHLNFPKEIDYESALESCLELIKISTYIYLLDNFKESKGAGQELELASQLKIPVVMNLDYLIALVEGREIYK